MLATAFSKKFSVAIGLRVAEIAGLILILSLSGIIFSNFSDKYHVKRHSDFSQNLESIYQIVLSPIYLIGILLCSIMAVNTVRPIISISAIVVFLTYNIFSSLNLLPTLSLMASSIVTISIFKWFVGSAK